MQIQCMAHGILNFWWYPLVVEICGVTVAVRSGYSMIPSIYQSTVAGGTLVYSFKPTKHNVTLLFQK